MGDWDVVEDNPWAVVDPGVVVEPAAPVRKGADQRYRETLKAMHSEDPSLAAGQGMAGPDLSAESHSPEKLAEEWGQVGKGVAKGVPATLAGGFLGDMEAMGRQLFKEKGVSQETFFPETVQGGYLGPKGLGWMDPAKTPEEAGGMTLGSMLVPGAFKAPAALRGVRGTKVPGVPTELPRVSTVDLMSGKEPPAPKPTIGTPSRLSPDTPHIMPREPEHSSAGAASNSLVEGYSPETLDTMTRLFRDENITPAIAEELNSQMSAHHFLGEATNNTEGLMGFVYRPVGEAKQTIHDAVRGRASEAIERMKALFDRSFGPPEDMAQLRRIQQIDQSKTADPLYKAFKELQIHPTDALKELIPALEEADAFGIAKKMAALKRRPWTENFFTTGPQKAYPTAESWDLIKQALDIKIGESFDNVGRPTKWTRIYTELKNDLINAIDNHPNPEVRGVWQKARKAWSDPEQIRHAQDLGKKLLNDNVDYQELPFITAGFSDPQMLALRQSIRSQLEHMFGRPGRQELKMINQMLAPNTEAKLRWVLGDGPAEELISGIRHEAMMHYMPQRVIGNSLTAERQAVDTSALAKYVERPSPLENVSLGDVAHGVTHPYQTAFGTAARAGEKRISARRAKIEAQIRDEMARLFVHQGPEREALMRYFAERAFPPQPPARKAGGRVQTNKPPVKGARKAHDGKWYIADKSRPGKFMRVDHG